MCSFLCKTVRKDVLLSYSVDVVAPLTSQLSCGLLQPSVTPSATAPAKPVTAPPAQPRKRDEVPPKKEVTDEPKKRVGPPPDSHQIFIGSLPPNVTESDIRSAFEG